MRNGLVLHGYCDSDWGGCKHSRKSVSGLTFLFAGAVVSCASKRQTTIALSSTEAEYYALALAVREALWLMQLLRDMLYSGKETQKVRIYP